MLEPELKFGQYLDEFGAKSVRLLVFQAGYRLEMDQELVEIERDFDILLFQYIPELGRTSTDVNLYENDNGID